MERVISNEMDFPQVVICAEHGYKKDVFTNMNVADDIFSDPYAQPDPARGLDILSLWENGTYMREELNVDWLYQLGKIA